MAGKRLWFKVDALFFEETGDTLTPAQQLAFLKLIAYCKRQGGDGHFGGTALRREGVTRPQLEALLTHDYVRVNDTGWVIRAYTDWQEKNEVKAAAGRAGAAARWGKK